MRSRQQGQSVSVWALGSILAILVIAIMLWGIPQYRIYSQRSAGEAALREAEYTRQISTLDAEAKINVAKGEAAAEVERAKGAAMANQILADSLEGKEDYLRYLYIQTLNNANSDRQVIYVPTNGLLPITESGRAVQPPVEQK